MKKLSKKKREEFKTKWLLPSYEFDKRVELIDNELAKYIVQDPYYEKYFQFKPIANFIDYGYYVANFSKITDEMLLHYIEACVRFIFLMKDEKEGRTIRRLLNPILNIITEYAKNDTFLELLIESEISGDERLNINGVESPISKKALKLHIKKRMVDFFALKPEDIVTAQVDFINYKRNIFESEESEQLNIENPELNLTFREDIVEELYNILKPFFSSFQHSELLRILRDGTDAKEKLIFRDNGNRLADMFKQLYDADLIAGCTKKKVEEWTIRNFLFISRNEVKYYKTHYVNDIISTNKVITKRPIIKVVEGKIIKR